MFNSVNFSNILKKILINYDSIRDFSDKSGFNRTSLSEYIRMEVNNPPSPDNLRKIADNSKGITTYIELMFVCGYIKNSDIEEYQMLYGNYENYNSLKSRVNNKLDLTSLTEREKEIAENLAYDALDRIAANQNISYEMLVQDGLKKLKAINDIDVDKAYDYFIFTIFTNINKVADVIVDLSNMDKQELEDIKSYVEFVRSKRKK